jgi:hypothetical protein
MLTASLAFMFAVHFTPKSPGGKLGNSSGFSGTLKNPFNG